MGGWPGHVNTNDRTQSLWTSLARSYLSCGGESECFQLVRLYYLVPAINREVKYQPKAQAGSFIRNDKLEAGKVCSNTRNFYISIAALHWLSANDNVHGWVMCWKTPHIPSIRQWKFGLCRLSSHDSQACKTILQVSSVLQHWLLPVFVSWPILEEVDEALNGMSLDRETRPNMALLSYLSGSQLKKQMVPECDIADTDWLIPIW